MKKKKIEKLFYTMSFLRQEPCLKISLNPQPLRDSTYTLPKFLINSIFSVSDVLTVYLRLTALEKSTHT